MPIAVFKRYEKKYLLTEKQYLDMRIFLSEYMDFDKYCLNNKSYHLYNLYLDSPDNELIRTSVDAPPYKEKLRIRSYYPKREYDEKVFFEIKQKYKGVVTKRRAIIKYGEAMEMVEKRQLPASNATADYLDKQVEKEILRMLVDYDLKPAVYIAYDRVAMFGKENPELRITFDREIYTRRENVTFDGDLSGEDICPAGKVLMEIKIPDVVPLWLARYMSENKIFNSSFSKYGTEYTNLMNAGRTASPEVENV